MRSVVWFLLLFAVAVVTATAFGTNDGLVSIYWNSWRVDTSLNLFLLVLLAGCFALVTAFQAINALVGLPRRAREWRLSQRERSAQSALRSALAQYFGGRYARAQNAAQRALAIQSDTPTLAQDHEFAVLGHLLWAASAHRLQDRPIREEQLQKAQQLAASSASAKAAEEGAHLLAAEWAIEDRDASRALELLGQLQPGVARRTYALRLRLQAARLAQQPQDALRTARLLAKHQGFSKEAALGLLRSLALEALGQARDADQLQRLWLQLDAADRRDPFVAARAAARAAQIGAAEEGRSWLKTFWDDITRYSIDERAALSQSLVSAVNGIGSDWLPRLEAATLALPRDPAVAHAAGRALAELKLWGKARQLLTMAANHHELPPATRRSAWRALAQIAEQQDDSAQAALCYRTAAQLDGLV